MHNVRVNACTCRGPILDSEKYFRVKVSDKENERHYDIINQFRMRNSLL